VKFDTKPPQGQVNVEASLQKLGTQSTLRHTLYGRTSVIRTPDSRLTELEKWLLYHEPQ